MRSVHPHPDKSQIVVASGRIIKGPKMKNNTGKEIAKNKVSNTTYYITAVVVFATEIFS